MVPGLMHAKAAMLGGAGLAILLAAAACSSSGPSEPVVFNLIRIAGEPIPTAADRFVSREADGTFLRRELMVLAGAVTLLPDKTWQQEVEMVRKITPIDPETGLPSSEGEIVEDFGRFVAEFGTYRWQGDTLFAHIDGPPLPAGSAVPGCCPPGGTFEFRPVPGSPTQFWSIQGNDWVYVYERVGAAPP